MTAAVSRPLRIAVIGGSIAGDEERAWATDVGRALARCGAVVVCGGRGGVMEAAARGASEAGGVTIGLLPGDAAEDANPWISLPLPTGLGEARNVLVVSAAESVVAVGGAWGTLSEIAFARRRGLQVAMLGTPPAEGLGLTTFDQGREAAEWAVAAARTHRGIPEETIP